MTGQLEHPGIVPVHDLGVDEDGRPFYVMSFIHGRTLREVAEEYHAGSAAAGESREVEFSRLLEVFVKMCQAVAYAHHRGVVHRDLKPDNVMLGPFGEALVLDWGMAKVLSQPDPASGAPPVQSTYSSGSAETQDGMVMGSPAYMAPEAAAGRAVDADARTDVYLLGATLYHVLTGRPPREGRSHEEAVELARTMPPPSPRRLRPEAPPSPAIPQRHGHVPRRGELSARSLKLVWLALLLADSSRAANVVDREQEAAHSEEAGRSNGKEGNLDQFQAQSETASAEGAPRHEVVPAGREAKRVKVPLLEHDAGDQFALGIESGHSPQAASRRLPDPDQHVLVLLVGLAVEDLERRLHARIAVFLEDAELGQIAFGHTQVRVSQRLPRRQPRG